MLVTAHLFGEKYLKEELEIFASENWLYLLAQKPKAEPLVAKSNNGFDFQTCPSSKQLLKTANEAELKRRQLVTQYQRIISQRTETGRMANLTIEAVLTTKQGRLVIYHFNAGAGKAKISAFLFSCGPSHQIKWYPIEPIWETPPNWKHHDVVFINLVRIKNRLVAYWLVDGRALFAVLYPPHKLGQPIKIKSGLRLKKYIDNPIISPRCENSWEAFTTFNPAAVYEAEKVHILYRAQGYDYFSSIGYAASQDGINIDERLNQPIFQPRQAFEKNTNKLVNDSYVSGGGYGGCEDPRVTKIGKRMYMTYVAFDGQNPPRLALTSISLVDFLARRWLWEKPVLISPPNVVDKSGCLLPEKINNKYVIFHRIFPNILVDFVDHLNFDGTWFLKGEFKIKPRSTKWWDSRKIGAGAPPLKTKDGWLLIYQAVDDKDDSHYKVGAMLLDLKNPTKVLYRSREPILEPNEKYELDGFKAGVVYPCGAVIIKDTLFVYYGAADSYVSVATANLNQFIKALKTAGRPLVQPTKVKSIRGQKN